ncbi:hypothetical protein [Zunongwangia endophytica]|uniref:Nudix hydrolase domain-containing protein n=1 Tax=Zunongwangia endophytica TaxID=1808945 RepID=A0ABV8H492_9FLAO|nr:hypothetical protein [Zunongwangia endophytica]MDN3594311.1 hypothetical protein [Zunongwangia endophytica]
MKKIVILIFFVLFQSVNAQVEKDIPIFHRLVILNAENELMVVKIENADFWVTPGMYQTKELSIKKGLDSIALKYGIKIENLKLNGVFILKRELKGEKSTSLRNVYTAKVKEENIKKPDGIEEIKWLSVDKAIETITFPHINEMIEKTMTKPNEVWGGTLLQYKENENWKMKILEEFYTL